MSTDPGIQDDDYSKQVLSRYDARHRSLIKIYTVFISFGTGFLAFILVPLMGLKLDAESLPQELAMQKKRLESMQPKHDELQEKNATLQEELQKLNQKLAKLGPEQEEIERQAIAVREEVEKVRIQLEETKKDKSLANGMLSAARKALDPEKYPALQEAAKRIYDKTLKEAQALERKISKLSVEEEDLEGNLETAEDKLKKIETQQKQLAVRTEPLRQQATEVETSVKVLEEELTNTRTELKRGQEAVAQMVQRQVDIRNRLSNFQSPFGALPLSLTEASLAFPFIVAVGFLIYAMLLADLLRLRCEYHRIVSANQTFEADTIHHRLALVVPLWLDPLKTVWRNSGGAALVYLPALAYFVIVWLITTDQFFELEAKRLDRHLIRFYSVLYVVGASFVAFGVWQILAEWTGYRTMLASEPSHTEIRDQ